MNGASQARRPDPFPTDWRLRGLKFLVLAYALYAASTLDLTWSRFVAGLGLPTRLSQVGIAPEEIPGLAARWNGDAPIATNPRKVNGAADIEEILRFAA